MKQEVTFAPDHPCFAGHFPGNPVVPGAVLLDVALAFAESLFPGEVSLAEMLHAKFPAAARPGQVCLFTAHGPRDGELRIDCLCGGALAMKCVFRFKEPGDG